jgi:hypothetical protein
MNENEIRKDCQIRINDFLKGDDTYTVYGPYIAKDGRKRVVIVERDLTTKLFTKRTMSYPKLIAEILLDGDVWPDDTVDHIDRNYENDDVFNLRVLPRDQHASKDALRVKVEKVKCKYCTNEFTPSKNQRNNINNAGPFCSNVCSGKYGTDIQKGLPLLGRTEIKKKYYRIEK